MPGQNLMDPRVRAREMGMPMLFTGFGGSNGQANRSVRFIHTLFG